MENIEVKLSINDCFNLFHQSFNRVKYFTCISESITASALPEKWEIGGQLEPKYSMKIPDNIDYLVDGYQHFIRRYLVRDSIESFSLCLDDLFFKHLLNGKIFSSNQCIKDRLSRYELDNIKKFQYKNLSDKINQLELDYGVKLSNEHKQLIESLRGIRNCFAHSNGIVRPNDGEIFGDERKFKWKSFHVFLRGIHSNEESPIQMDVSINETSEICFRFNEYERSFKVGESIFFTAKETFEIAWSLEMVALDYIQTFNKNLNKS